MKEMNFTFILYSKIFETGGGRETWIRNFIPVLSLTLAGKANIRVISLQGGEKSQKQNIEFSKYCELNELIKPSWIPTSLWRSIVRYFFFVFHVLRMVGIKRKNKENIIAIGSLWEAFPFILMRTHESKNVIWLRGVMGSEIRKGWLNKLRLFILFLERIALKKADIIIANGYDTKQAYLNLGFSSSVIPNALDLKKYEINPLVNSNKFIISYVGRLSKEKGLSDYLLSITDFNKKHPEISDNFEFHVVGDGPLIDEVIKFNQRNFKYLGLLCNDKMPHYLSSVTATVNLTYSSDQSRYPGGGGVSNSLIETMAAGRIPICWKTFVYTQIVDESFALLVSEGNVEELASSFERLTSSNTNPASLGKKARDKASEFSIEKHVESFLTLLQEGATEGKNKC